MIGCLCSTNGQDSITLETRIQEHTFFTCAICEGIITT